MFIFSNYIKSKAGPNSLTYSCFKVLSFVQLFSNLLYLDWHKYGSPELRDNG